MNCYIVFFLKTAIFSLRDIKSEIKILSLNEINSGFKSIKIDILNQDKKT